MIYSDSYYRKELRLCFSSGSRSVRNMLVVPSMTALMALALHRTLLLLEGSVLGERLHFLLPMSSFSVLTLYRFVCALYLLGWFYRFYSTVTFAGISKNRWYLLRKLHRKPAALILGKTLSVLTVVVLHYSEGMLLTWFLSGLFGYTTHLPTVLPLYLAGLANITMECSVFLFLSLVFLKRNDTIVFALMWTGFCIALYYVSGYQRIVRNPALLARPGLPVSSGYFIFMAVSTLLLTAGSVGLAYRRSARYYLNPGVSAPLMQDPFSGKVRRDRLHYLSVSKRAYRVVLTFLMLLVSLVLALSALAVLFSGRTAQGEYTMLGYIPYQMETTELSETVEQYDLALFRRNGSQSLRVGDVILYRDPETAETKIKKVVLAAQNSLGVEIKTTDGTGAPVTRVQTLPKSAVSGVMVMKSSLIGGLLLICRSPMGTVLFLALPLILIFFYDDLVLLHRRLKAAADKQE